MDANRDHWYQRNWEEWALLDPKWAICTRRDKKYGKWGDEEFFDSGRNEVEGALRQIEANKLHVHYGRALDFGCGVGRLTRALSGHFNEVVGVDCSGTMISIAREMHKSQAKITFHEHQGHDLRLYNDNEFDFVFSLITLQHVPDTKIIKRYLEEFLRVAKPGGVIYFNLPTESAYPLLKEWLLKIRGVLYSFAVRLGFSRKYLYYKLRFKPFMCMNHLPAEEVECVCRPQAEAFVVVNNRPVDTRFMLSKRMSSPSNTELENNKSRAVEARDAVGN